MHCNFQTAKKINSVVCSVSESVAESLTTNYHEASAVGAGALSAEGSVGRPYLGGEDTRRVLRAMLSSTLQFSHFSFASSPKLSTPSTEPKNMRFSALQSGHGPLAIKGFL